MNNLLKVSAAALFLAVGLTSCEAKPATETTTTETTTTPATESTTSTMATDSAATMAPAADGAMMADTTKKM